MSCLVTAPVVTQRRHAEHVVIRFISDMIICPEAAYMDSAERNMPFLFDAEPAQGR